MIKPGATVIDVGITRITDELGKTKLVGDVDYDGKFFDNIILLVYVFLHQIYFSFEDSSTH